MAAQIGALARGLQPRYTVAMVTLIGQQRIVIGMYDGFGMDYFDASPLPAYLVRLRRIWERRKKSA